MTAGDGDFTVPVLSDPGRTGRLISLSVAALPPPGFETLSIVDLL